MAYTPTNWQNLPNTTTPITANALNNMETGIEKSDKVLGVAEYNATSTYDKGDYCAYNNVLYRANQDISTAEAWNSAHWDATTIIDNLGGNIIDTFNTQEDKHTNAPSINAVDNFVSDKTEPTSYSLSIVHTAHASNCLLKKMGHLVVLQASALWCSSVTQNAWQTVATINDSVLLPSQDIIFPCNIFSGNDGNMVGYGLFRIKTSGVIEVKSSASYSYLPGVTVVAVWFV